MTAPNVLRYPGGKAKVARRIVDRMPGRIDQYCEPMCGGASVALEVALRHPEAKLWLADISEQVACLWAMIAGGEVEVLVERYRATTPTVEEFRRLQGMWSNDRQEMAWAALFLNRTSYSGKEQTTPIGGWAQSGDWLIDAEWRERHVVDNLRAAQSILQGRTVVCCQSWEEGQPYDDWFLYLDPPYYGRGPSMYRHGTFDHEALADWLPEHDNWTLSYDDCAGVRALYGWARVEALEWSYSSHHQAENGPIKGRELVIRPA